MMVVCASDNGDDDNDYDGVWDDDGGGDIDGSYENVNDHNRFWNDTYFDDWFELQDISTITSIIICICMIIINHHHDHRHQVESRSCWRFLW